MGSRFCCSLFQTLIFVNFIEDKVTRAQSPAKSSFSLTLGPIPSYDPTLIPTLGIAQFFSNTLGPTLSYDPTPIPTLDTAQFFSNDLFKQFMRAY